MIKRRAEREDAWETLAKRDALWATCTSGKRHVNWQLHDFLATGEREVSWAINTAKENSIYPCHKLLVVDFGCGPGRLIGVLKKSFTRVIGVDTSPTMRTLARQAHPEENVGFSSSTTAFDEGSVDLIYSTFVLQHLPQDQLGKYFDEFSRLLHPKGLLIFQYPAGPRRTLVGLAFLLLPSALIHAVQRYILRYPGIMPMSWMTPEQMFRYVEDSDLTILQYRTGPIYSPNWEDIWYFAYKRNNSNV